MNKQMIGVVVCVLIIIVAVIVTVKRMGGESGGPTELSEQTGTFMAIGSDEPVTMTVKDYMALPANDEGEHLLDGAVLRSAVDCPHCQARIPGPPPKLEEAAALRPETNPEYPCPKCSKNVFKLPEDGAQPEEEG